MFKKSWPHRPGEDAGSGPLRELAGLLREIEEMERDLGMHRGEAPDFPRHEEHGGGERHAGPPPYPPYPPFPPYPAYPAYPPYPPYPPNPACQPAPPAQQPGGIVVTGAMTCRSQTPQGSGSSSSGQAQGGSGSSSSSAGSSSSSGAAPSPSSSSAGQGALTNIKIDPIAGTHKGTSIGTAPWTATKLAVVPGSVPGSGKLAFTTATMNTVTMLYQLNEPASIPNWFGVALRPSTADFTKPNLFFHPLPAQALYNDLDYAAKDGAHGTDWKILFHYMERLGYQLDGAGREQVIIMPFLTESVADTVGIFPARWHSLATDILTDVRKRMGKDPGTPLVISEVVVSSFSAGNHYSAMFRKKATDLYNPVPLLKEVWDFDGFFSTTDYQYSLDLKTTPQYRAIKYDQVSEPGSFHVHSTRWSAYPDPQPNPAPPGATPAPDQDYPKKLITKDVHHAIRDYMFLHAATNPPAAP